MPPELIVERSDGQIVCHKVGAVGSYIQGTGSTVLEAVGSWCLHAQLVEVQCNPPSLVTERYSVAEPKAPSRAD
jgi:hypothetical protein